MPEVDDTPEPRDLRLALVASIVGSVAVFVDGTVVNVALPAIRRDLGGGLAGQQWLADAYLLTLGSLLLIGGSLGDLFGRRRAFRAGVAAFGVTSMLCAAAPTIGILEVARGLQGLAGALLVPNTLGLLVAKFPEERRGEAIGKWTAWTGIAFVAGPLAGGLILQVASWRWLFGINLIPVAIAWVVAGRLSAAHDHPAGGHVDYVGGLLGSLGLAGPVYALIEEPSRGWGSPSILAPLIGGLVLLVAFAAYERRAREPMLDLSLFANRNFAVGNAATLAVYGGLGAIPFFVVLFLQQVAGYTPLGAGLALLPISLIMFALSPRFGAAAGRHGPRVFMAVGPLVGALGVIAFLRIDAGADYVTEVLPAVCVFGLGLSLTVAPLTAAILGGVPEAHAGMASGVNNAVARVAGLLAVAAIGAAVAAEFSSAVSAHAASPGLSAPAHAALESARGRVLVVSPPAGAGAQGPLVHAALVGASQDAFHLAMEVVAGLVAIGGLLSAAGIENPRRRPVGAAEAPA